VKAARAFFHGAADVFIFGLWEVIGTPGEAIFSGSKMKVEVGYDAEDRVMSARNLESPKDMARRWRWHGHDPWWRRRLDNETTVATPIAADEPCVGPRRSRRRPLGVPVGDVAGASPGRGSAGA